jgi:DNA-binding transcriptional ArsR family regulator
VVKHIEPLDRVFHALADGTRREILAGLARGDRSVTEIAAPFAMSLPAVSKHVRVLERAGLVQRTVDGRVHRIELDASPLRAASSWLEAYRRFWEERFAALEDMLKEKRRG